MDYDVVIAGAGPNGLMLAAELRLAGVRPLVLERLPERATAPKANGLAGVVARLMDARGLYEKVSGWPAPPATAPFYMFGGMRLDLRDLSDNPMHTVLCPQTRLEAILEEHAVGLGAEIRRGVEVTGFVDHVDHVTVQTGAAEFTAHFLVGCDGGRSTVRKLAGIDFPGVTDDEVVSRSVNVVLPTAGSTGLPVAGHGDIPPFFFHRTTTGVFIWARFDDVQSVTTMEWGDAPDDDVPMTLDELAASVRRVLGTDVQMELPVLDRPLLMRRNRGRNTRITSRFRLGRVLLAGDAAHIHSGIGGPGLNAGLQDVANLAWKLGATIQGWAPAGLLDTYHSERYPVAERVAMQTQAQSALLSPGSKITALRTLFDELLAPAAARQHIVDTMSGNDIRYFTGDHPLVGALVPELAVTTTAGVVRLAELRRTGRPLLLDLAGVGSVADGWRDRVDVVSGTSADHPAQSGHPALLIRPDGFVAWAGSSADGLVEALERWFGSATA
ncbi:FAD-dependent monooxygenase [Kutzneria sp. CA-103260]|uniref:FAD-dependent monooxygenase n=1 Tax=Kutzneria sp. CA-103260 TaxID=2802641 RepID=UPI001BAA1A8C|nr:FAD-dependent monooxygenase [Kutzneria sp. CA-103260]QUQ64811.1 FAD-dependent oxidoreductase [Kutzneria sp. CA-103260]